MALLPARRLVARPPIPSNLLFGHIARPFGTTAALGARRSPATATTSPRILLGAARGPKGPGDNPARQLQRQQVRWYAGRPKHNRGQYKSSMNTGQDSASPQVAMHSDMLAAQMSDRVLLPGVIAPLRLWQWPRHPVKFFKYLYQYGWFRFAAFSVSILFRLRSRRPTPGQTKTKWKKGFLGTFDPQRRKIIPAARALHRTMNEAMAAGDAASLKEVVHPPLLEMLAQALQARRKKGVETQWELVRHHRPWMSPKVLFHRVAELPEGQGSTSHGPGGAPRYAQQVAVVEMDSSQRLKRWDARTGRVLGDKEERRRENVVLMRVVDCKTQEVGEWKIWGFEDGMGLERLVEERNLIWGVTEGEVEKKVKQKMGRK